MNHRTALSVVFGLGLLFTGCAPRSAESGPENSDADRASPSLEKLNDAADDSAKLESDSERETPRYRLAPRSYSGGGAMAGRRVIRTRSDD